MGQVPPRRKTTGRDLERLLSGPNPQSRSILAVVKVQTVPGRDDSESH